jgi:hypothetical protein
MHKIARADVVGSLLRPAYLLGARSNFIATMGVRDARDACLERLALSPQCGFASGDYATTMTHAGQEAKLPWSAGSPPACGPSGEALHVRRLQPRGRRTAPCWRGKEQVPARKSGRRFQNALPAA